MREVCGGRKCQASSVSGELQSDSLSVSLVRRLSHTIFLTHLSLCFSLTLDRIVRRYKSTLDPDLVCMGEAQQSRWWALVGGCVFITLVLVVWRWFRGSDDGEPLMGGSAHSSRRGSLTDTLARIKSPVGGMRGF